MKYKTLVNVNHNNRKYGIGDLIELSDNEAAPLLECKAIEPQNKPYAARTVTVKVNAEA
jgi:hypothetical protein